MKAAGASLAGSFRARVASCMEQAEALCLRVRSTLKEKGLAHLCFPVELLARECLANAVTHGNGRDADKSVELRFAVGREWIRLEVADEGPGFDWRKGLQSQAPTDACGGRGLNLYEMYADRVQFNRRGNRITLWVRKTKAEKEEEKMAAYLIEQKDHEGSVKLMGDLTAILVPELQAGLMESLNKGALELEFDLSKTTMLDSSGIGLLIATANSLTHKGGKVRVTNVCPNIYRLLQSMRLTGRLNVSGVAA